MQQCPVIARHERVIEHSNFCSIRSYAVLFYFKKGDKNELMIGDSVTNDTKDASHRVVSSKYLQMYSLETIVLSNPKKGD